MSQQIAVTFKNLEAVGYALGYADFSCLPCEHEGYLVTFTADSYFTEGIRSYVLRGNDPVFIALTSAIAKVDVDGRLVHAEEVALPEGII